MLRLQTLGTIDLRREGGERVDELLEQPKRLALLAYLAPHQPRGPVRREKIVSVLWPDSSSTSARAALSTTLSRLRDTLGGEVLRGRGQETIVLSDRHFTSDVAAFREAFDAGRFPEAVELYGGPFLEGFRPPDARPFEDWMVLRREQYHERAYRAAMEAAGEARRAGDVIGAEAFLRRAREIDPLREEAVREVVDLRVEHGDTACPIKAYRDFRDRLDQEVGLSPSEELRSRIRALTPGGDGGEVERGAS